MICGRYPDRIVPTALIMCLCLFSTIARAQQAHAHLINTKGDTIGMITFTQTDSGVLGDINLHDVPPGVHALHIHEESECAPPDFKSAGSHFNPSGARHGFLNPQGPHAGDLPNITADKNGLVKTQFRTGLISLKKDAKNSLLGKNGASVIIHEKPDDYITDPAGASGNRIACGVVIGS